jgi:hypothetical protein
MHVHPLKPLKSVWDPKLDPNEVIETFECRVPLTNGKCPDYDYYIRTLDRNRKYEELLLNEMMGKR